MKGKSVDILILALSYISSIVLFYYNGLSQSNSTEQSMAPIPVLLIPFFVAMLQIIRLFTIKSRIVLDSVGKIWIYILIYYIFAFVIGFGLGHVRYNYNTYWTVVCPPVMWIYFNAILKYNQGMADTLVKWGFWAFICFSAVSLYYIPRSINSAGHFASLNTGYYVLMAYPLAFLDNNRIKKIVSTVLMLAVVLMSMKRGGFLSVAAAFVLYFLFSSNKKILVKLLIIAVSVSLIYCVVPLVNELSNGTLEARYEFTKDGGDDEGRSMMYLAVWDSIWESDFVEILFGHGHNGVSSIKILRGLSAHNDYLEFLYDFGIIGIVLLLSYQIQLFKLVKKSKRNNEEFFPTIFAFTSVVVLSMVSIVCSFYYFLLIIPFWEVINNRLSIK